MTEPIRPPNTGLTDEARAALAAENPELLDGIDSDADGDEGISPQFPVLTAVPFTSTGDDIVDAEIVDDAGQEKPAARARRERTRTGTESGTAREAKSTPPTVSEWEAFFSRVVLKLITEYYINWAFRGIDEDRLSERELDRLAMTDDERSLISVPLAEISSKSKIMRRHGRMIVASGDALNAFVVLGMWASRVNRIAAKYRPKVVKGQVNGSSRSNEAPPNGAAFGATGGRFPEWYSGPIQPGSG